MDNLLYIIVRWLRSKGRGTGFYRPYKGLKPYLEEDKELKLKIVFIVPIRDGLSVEFIHSFTIWEVFIVPIRDGSP